MDTNFAIVTLAQAGVEAAAAPAPATGGQAISPLGGVPTPTTTTTAVPANGTAVVGAPAGAARPQSPLGALLLPVGFAVLLVVMLVMSSRAQKKEKARRDALMGSLKKGDRVVTSGGVIGEIHEILENEVVLRVEDGRIRFAKSAVQATV